MFILYNIFIIVTDFLWGRLCGLVLESGLHQGAVALTRMVINESRNRT